MARQTPIITNFTTGELTPRLNGRLDLGWHQNGCQRQENMVSQPHGPVMTRPGDRWVGKTKDRLKKARLFDFVFAEVAAYAIEAGELYYRFYQDGGRIENPVGTPVEVVSPYLENELEEIGTTQSADVLYKFHKNHGVRKLSRTSHVDWTLTAADFKNGPFLPENITSVTITSSGVTGTITLTASADTFDPLHVGALFLLKEQTTTLPFDPWKIGEAVTAGANRENNGSVYDAQDTDTTGERQPLHTKPNEIVSDGVVDWKYLHSGFGVVKITTYTSPTLVTAVVQSRLPFSTTSGTEHWAEGAWSDLRGYPSVGVFHEERLWLANTPHQPQTFWGSQTNDFENMQSGADDADAVSFTISSRKGNPIKWLVSADSLLIGTAGRVWEAKASLDDPITPSNITVKKKPEYGSEAITPLEIGNSIVFVQRHGQKLRELVFDIGTNNFVAPDLMERAEHLTNATRYIKGMAYMAEPWPIIWGYRSDGRLLAFTYEREQAVTAWAPQPQGGNGAVESLITIPGVQQDELWMITCRTVNGLVERWIERQDPFPHDDTLLEDMFFVDAGLTYDGVPTQVVTGLLHLRNQTCKVLADGAVHGDVKVDNLGQVTLDYPASKIHVGLGRRALVQPMRFEAGARTGTAQGKLKSYDHVVVRLDRSLGMQFGSSEDDLEALPFRGASVPMGSPPALFTGDRRFDFAREITRDGDIVIVQDQPLPLTIVAMMPRVTVGES